MYPTYLYRGYNAVTKYHEHPIMIEDNIWEEIKEIYCEYVCCTLLPPQKNHAFLLVYKSVLLLVERVESRLMSQHMMMFE